VNKRIAAKYHGGENNNNGIEYEIQFAIKKFVEMILPTNSGIQIVKITRQAKEYVDDVVEEKSNNIKVFYQCKHYKIWPRKSTRDIDEKNFWRDFLLQYEKENSYSELVLVTQNKDSGFDNLSKLAKECNSFEAFKNKLTSDSSNAERDKFSYMKSIFEEENNEFFIYSFLKKFRIASYDDYFIEEDSLKALMTKFSEEDAKNIFNLFHKNLNKNWLGREITKDIVKSDLKKIGISVERLEPQIYLDVKRSSSSQSTTMNIFENNEGDFSKKLDSLLELINRGKSLYSKELSHEIAIIESDDNLVWHFLKNLNDPTWFPTIKDNIIKSVSEDPNNQSTKYQLLNYFKKCSGTYSDEIIPFLLKLEKNTQDFNILARLIETTSSLKPKSPESFIPLWQIFNDLVEHQHPWVRREIPRALISFIEIDDDKVFDFLYRLFAYSPPPQNVTQGTPTLSLTFQGSDNENWVFEEATLVIRELLSNPQYAQKAHVLARKIEVNALIKDERSNKSVQGITIDYSSFWLSEESYGNSELEFNHDRKERIALEIEKSLNELVIKNKDLCLILLNELLLEKREVFHLIVIKILIKYARIFPELCKSLVLNTDIWKVYNIRRYYLQTLATTYFTEVNENEISEFVKMVDQQKLEDSNEILYLQQDMLVSIPEVYRTIEINDKLNITSQSLKIKPEISKPFTITTWSGLLPDITIEDLETKSESEIIKIMQDSSDGKRAAPFDIAPVFSQLIDRKPDLLPNLLYKMEGKNISPNFAGEMVEAYRKKKSEDVVAIADLIKLLGENDTWARIEIARYFYEICQKNEIQNLSPNEIERIRDSLITLTNDKDPESDNKIKFSNPNPDDAITEGINSVRRKATEALVAFCYYFPSDENASQRLRELASDNTKAVKATLIYSLRNLANKNFALCENIVNNFKDIRDPEIDYALIHFFSQLNCDKFLQYQDFIKLLFNDPNDQINEDLGELIGIRYINGCNVQSLLDELIGNRKGTKDTRRSLAFVFESRMGKIIGQANDKIVASYLKKLMNPQNEFEVVERASFVFQRDEIKPENFEFMDDNGLTTELILNRFNIPAQAHLVNYLQKCVESGICVDRCVDLLHEQVNKIEGILSDQLVVIKVADIVAKLIKDYQSTKTQKSIQEIFNAGLEKGWDEFYKIYFDLRDNTTY
jgi:hypothetical protein